MILRERHARLLATGEYPTGEYQWTDAGGIEFPCTCSHCHGLEYDAPWSIGFRVPIEKAFNSWFILYLVTTRANHYVRFTLPFLKRPS